MSRVNSKNSFITESGYRFVVNEIRNSITYLFQILFNHGLNISSNWSMHKVHLRDKTLAQEFTKGKAGNKASYFVDTLRKAGLIEKDSGYFPKKISTGYTFNLHTIRDFIDKYDLWDEQLTQYYLALEMMRSKKVELKPIELTFAQKNQLEELKNILRGRKLVFGRNYIRKTKKIVDDNVVRAYMMETYPIVGVIQAVYNRLNELNEENIYNFQIHVYRGKTGMITSIGARGTSIFCSTQTYKNHPDKKYCTCREYDLDVRFGCGSWKEFDVKGSIPKVHHLMHTGEWLDETIDPYKVMYGDVVKRDFAKQLFMHNNFGRSANDQKYKVRYTYLNGNKVHKGHTEFVNYISEMSNDERDYLFEYCMNNYHSFCGKQTGTYDFLVETLIYGLVSKKLFEDGYENVLVYDCFYGNLPSNTVMQKYLKETALEVYNILK